jgi:hypothetical protein
VSEKPRTAIEEAQERFRATTQAAAAARAAQATVTPQKASRKPGAKGKTDAGRWATLNAFHDTVARHLTLAEQAVWSHLFRWCRDGKVSVSTREIAAGCGIDKETATLALAKLKAVGLVWVVNLSRHKGTASVYGLHPHPDSCLQQCQAAGRPRKPR